MELQRKGKIEDEHSKNDLEPHKRMRVDSDQDEIHEGVDYYDREGEDYADYDPDHEGDQDDLNIANEDTVLFASNGDDDDKLKPSASDSARFHSDRYSDEDDDMYLRVKRKIRRKMVATLQRNLHSTEEGTRDIMELIDKMFEKKDKGKTKKKRVVTQKFSDEDTEGEEENHDDGDEHTDGELKNCNEDADEANDQSELDGGVGDDHEDYDGGSGYGGNHDQPSDGSELEDDEHTYIELCKENLIDVLKTRLQYDDAQIDQFMQKVKFKVSDLVFEDYEEVRTVRCKTRLPGRNGKHLITVCFDYHYRTRMTYVEHRTELTVRKGKKYFTIFQNNMANAQTECRYFAPRIDHLKTIRDSLFDPSHRDNTTLFATLLLIYAACSVPFEDSDSYEEIIESFTKHVGFKGGWLEHHSRVLTNCENEIDDNYATDDTKDVSLDEWEKELEIDQMSNLLKIFQLTGTVSQCAQAQTRI